MGLRSGLAYAAVIAGLSGAAALAQDQNAQIQSTPAANASEASDRKSTRLNSSHT